MGGESVCRDGAVPDVLVARAETNGTCLDAMFPPGTDGGTFEIALAQLQPGRHYAVTGALSETVTAGADGSAAVYIDLHGRVEFSVVPEA